MGIYTNIETQQKMIVDLVNNTISNREKDLKQRNDELRKRIEDMEKNQDIEQISKAFQYFNVQATAKVMMTMKMRKDRVLLELRKTETH